jgi:hypothetical protein
MKTVMMRTAALLLGAAPLAAHAQTAQPKPTL